MKHALALSAAVLSIVAQSAYGNPVMEAFISGQPLQYMREGRVNGCGVRLVGMVEPPPGAASAEGFDVSFNLNLPGFGVVKGGGFLVPVDEMRRGKLTGGGKRKPDALWLRAEGADATRPRPGSVQQAQDPPEAILYATQGLDEVMELFKAVGTLRLVQVGMKFPRAGVERIYQGTVRMEPNEYASVERCMGDLIRGLEKAR